MKVTGFTFIRNAIKYDYPVVESIGSILPLCDEVIVAVGKSDDNTRELIESISSPKIKIIDTNSNKPRNSGSFKPRKTEPINLKIIRKNVIVFYFLFI